MKDWDGSVRFRRAKFSDIARGNTAKVIRDVKADVICLVEVEDRPVLSAFNSQRLYSRYRYNMLIDGNDDRGIDVALLSKLPISGLRSHIFDREGKKQVFSRDCLEVQLDLPGGKGRLHVLCNHFKSRGYGSQATSDAKRCMQAERVAEILKQDYDLAKDLVVVAGDLNDSPTRPPQTLQPLLGLKGLSDVLKLQFPNSPADRWTYHYKQHEQIDYLLVSKPLRGAFKKAVVFRKGIYQLDKVTGGKEEAYKTVTHWANAASDHAAVWADFEL